jgi:outer membrane receptor protein involved in Fe transport
MQDSLSRLYRDQENQYDNSSSAVFAQANWHFTEPFTLTTGVRFTKEDRQTTSSALIADNGAGAPLNPESIDVVNHVPLGGFNTYATNRDPVTGATAVIGALTR